MKARKDMLNKNKNISNTTIITGCQPFVTEDGYVIPLLHFEPIFINRNIFKNQVIYTWDEFDKMNPKLNDRVSVVPGNDKKYTLFNLDGRTKDKTHIPISKPTTCPECDSKLKAIGSNLYCTNYECPAADIRRALRYLYFCCVHLDIVYRDLVTVCKHGYIKNIGGLYTTHPTAVLRYRNLPFIAEKVKEVTLAANSILKVDVQNIYFSLLPEVDPTTALKIAQLREKNIQWFEPISKKELNGHKELEDDVMKLNKELVRNRKYYKMLDEIVSVENNSRTPQFEGKTFVVGETSFYTPDYYCVIIALNGGTYQKDYLTFPLENADFILGELENEEERMFKKIKSNKTMPKKITESMFRSIIPILYAKSKYKINLINSRKEYLKLVGNDE